MTFEESLIRLEEILKQLDSGKTDLETALTGYEEGVGLLKNCHGLLETARRKIEVLRGTNQDGSSVIEPLES
jgi:exodeoxyribonuclease VII small subunit